MLDPCAGTGTCPAALPAATQTNTPWATAALSPCRHRLLMERRGRQAISLRRVIAACSSALDVLIHKHSMVAHARAFRQFLAGQAAAPRSPLECRRPNPKNQPAVVVPASAVCSPLRWRARPPGFHLKSEFSNGKFRQENLSVIKTLKVSLPCALPAPRQPPDQSSASRQSAQTAPAPV